MESQTEEKIVFTNRQKEVIFLAKRGLTYKEMAEHLCCSYSAVNDVTKTLYKKLKVTSMRKMLSKVKEIEDNKTTIFEIAKKEWEEMYPNGHNSIMNTKESEFAWEHWLRAWKLAQKRFR